MNEVLFSMYAKGGTVLAFLSQKQKEGLNFILSWVMAIALLYGVVMLIIAAIKREDDPSGPKKALVTLAWIVLGTGIVFGLAKAVGLDSVAVDRKASKLG